MHFHKQNIHSDHRTVHFVHGSQMHGGSRRKTGSPGVEVDEDVTLAHVALSALARRNARIPENLVLQVSRSAASMRASHSPRGPLTPQWITLQTSTCQCEN